MDLKKWIALILVSTIRLAIRAGLTSLLIPMSAAADLPEVMANQRANAFFEQEVKPVAKSVSDRVPSSLETSSVTPKKKSAMSTAVNGNDVPENDYSNGGITRPLVNVNGYAPKGFPTTFGTAAPLPVAPPPPPAAAAPAIPSLPSAPAQSAPAQTAAPAAPAQTAPAQSTVTQDPPAPAAQAQPSTPAVPAQGLDLPADFKPYVDNTGKGITPDPAAKKFTGMSPGSDTFPTQSPTAAKINCPTGDCGKLNPIDTKRVAAMSPSSNSGGMNCAQKAILTAARAVTPNPNVQYERSPGKCAIGVGRILNSVENKIPGFDSTPIPQNFRYPLTTRYSPGFQGWLGNSKYNNDWTSLPLKDRDHQKDYPPGTVLVFGGPQDPADYNRNNGYMATHAGTWVGHVTIVGKQDDPKLSGFWTDVRTSTASGSTRHLVAAYAPGQKQIEACGGK
jgi:hypothetical protein